MDVATSPTLLQGVVTMSKYLLREYYELCEGGVCEDLLTEEEKRMVRENNVLILSGIMQRADAQNGNGRVYPRPILERETIQMTQLLILKMHPTWSLTCGGTVMM